MLFSLGDYSIHVIIAVTASDYDKYSYSNFK